MRKIVCVGLLLATTALHVGCVIPMYSADPAIRSRQLIYVSENLRMINDIWERMWFVDMPDTETPYRTHGGVIQAFFRQRNHFVCWLRSWLTIKFRGVNPLEITLNRLRLRNPILVASGTFGYAREMQSFAEFACLGGIIPKTVTLLPRMGNPPPRTVETASGLLNSIGLDNDGIEAFLDKHLSYLLGLGTAVIVNIAGHDIAEFGQMAKRLNSFKEIAAVELNISCPNVSGGVDFATDPKLTSQVISEVRAVCDLPVIAKLTPNVTRVVDIAAAAEEAGADAVTLINTLQGMAVDWKRRKPILGNVLGGLSGPAIKPLALRIVHQVAQAVKVPIIGVGGIQSIDDVMEFLVTGATAVQIGTANFYDPTLASRLVDQLADVVKSQGCQHVTELIGSLQLPNRVGFQK